ncbi:MAG: hypothetical protein JST16_12380 [Bdellovibrionales bacterium]|nr:hypothetical protein [Bdellovibrionales bacterium]
MSTNSNSNPLGNRGKAAEDDWARRRDAEAIDAMKKKDQAGKDAGTAPASDKGGKGKKSAKGK